MKKSIIWSLLLLLFVAMSSQAQMKRISPNWKEGDHRIVTSANTVLVLVENDTFMNTDAEIKSKITVEEATSKGYVVNYEHLAFEDLDFDLNIDGIDSMEAFQAITFFIGGLVKAADKAAKSTQVKYNIAKDGEALSIVDFDQTMTRFQEAVVTMMQELEKSMKEIMGDSLNLPIDPMQINNSLASKKEDVRAQMLNQVNFLNQAYYELTYDRAKKKTFESIITEVDAIKYGTVEVEGEIITEILEDNKELFKVKITTKYEEESLKKAIAENIGEAASGAYFMDDYMVFSFDPTSNWIQELEIYQHLKLADVEVKNMEMHKFSK